MAGGASGASGAGDWNGARCSALYRGTATVRGMSIADERSESRNAVGWGGVWVRWVQWVGTKGAALSATAGEASTGLSETKEARSERTESRVQPLSRETTRKPLPRTLARHHKIPVAKPEFLLVLRTDALDTLFEVDFRFPAGRFVNLLVVGAGVVNVDVVGNRILDVLGFDVGPEFVV